MSAAEVIEKIKALPPEEQEEVRRFVLNGSATVEERPPVKYMSREQFDDAMDHVFKEHHELLRRLAE